MFILIMQCEDVTCTVRYCPLDRMRCYPIRSDPTWDDPLLPTFRNTHPRFGSVWAFFLARVFFPFASGSFWQVFPTCERCVFFLFVLLVRSLSALAPKSYLSESTLDWVIFGVAVGIGVWFDRPYSSWAGTVWMGLGWSGLEWSG